MDFVTSYLDQYGYLVLFVALLLELLALPLPGEVMMSYAGYLVYQGHLNWFFSILLAGMGSSLGMTISYWIGSKLGSPFFEKHGHRILLGPDRLKKISDWFRSSGNKVIMIAFFIPGIRHITGYFSGITKIRFRTYAIFAYIGAFLWVSVFISLGKILGPQWDQFHATVKKYFVLIAIIALLLVAIVYVIKKYRRQIIQAVMGWLANLIHLFHTQRRTGVFLVVIMVTTIGFIVLMIGLTQDFLANEFKGFNDMVTTIIPLLFNQHWDPVMRLALQLGSQKFLIAIPILTFFFIIWKGKDKLLESFILLLVIAGGELYEEGLRRIFHQLSPVHYSHLEKFPYSFPSEQSLMAFVIYGFFIFMLVRHMRRFTIHAQGSIAFLVILLLMAVSRIYFAIQLPSEVVAGYVFGGVWLGLSILLLEILRLMRVVTDQEEKEE